jgi:menaquinone-dependent protoporphyrinogen oxidase
MARTDHPTALVAYATRHGSTRAVAEEVAERLRLGGWQVDVRPAGDVADLAGVDAVVLGGALYTGRWHPAARRFLRRHRAALATVPLAVFAMGPRTLADEDVATSRRQLQRELDRCREVTPRSAEIFGGVVDPAALPFPFSRMQASDARDWEAIRTWGDELAGYLPAAQAVAGAR